MKTLNLEQLGVQEMDAVEVKSTDGGFCTLLIIAGVQFAIGYSIYGAYQAGYDAAQNEC